MRIRLLFIAALFAMLGALIAPAPASASNTGGVIAAINRAVAVFNNGDLKAWAASCDSPAAIIDDFPPHTWQGATACTDWATAFANGNKQAGITHGRLTLGTPLHAEATGDRAYVVYPATFNYDLKGKPMKHTAVFTLALRKSAGTWKIAAWSWGQQH